jgi:peptide-methionine (S)-S-oxide reductase
VGYAGGTTSNPTYDNIGDYSETIEVEYDAAIVSYEQLLAAFWNSHDATYPPYSSQYRSAIFYTTDQQRELANESRKAEEANVGQTIYTDIAPHASFYVAEDYHQKYYLRQTSDIVNAIYTIYPNPADFRDSATAARLNGYLGGYGDFETLKSTLDKLGLSESGKRTLMQVTSSGLTHACPVIPLGGP